MHSSIPTDAYVIPDYVDRQKPCPPPSPQRHPATAMGERMEADKWRSPRQRIVTKPKPPENNAGMRDDKQISEDSPNGSPMCARTHTIPFPKIEEI
jgi:hypothetical protein